MTTRNVVLTMLLTITACCNIWAKGAPHGGSVGKSSANGLKGVRVNRSHGSLSQTKIKARRGYTLQLKAPKVGAKAATKGSKGYLKF